MTIIARMLIAVAVLAAPAMAGSGVPQRPAAVDEVADAVSPARLRAAVDRLAGFGTRHTLSQTESDVRGIGAARRWLRDELAGSAEASGRSDITVELVSHAQPRSRRIPEPAEVVNVVMTIPGSMPEARGRMYVVLGHYDSRNSNVMDAEDDAPGANDDGSGTALVLELGRIFASRRCDATIVFLMTAGEEQGLYGARAFAAAAAENGWNIAAALSNDMVGDPTGPAGRSAPGRVRVFSRGLPGPDSPDVAANLRRFGAPGDSPSRQLARYVHEIAGRHETTIRPWLIYRADRFGRGGDHSAFNEQGFAAVRFTEVYENYDRQHQDVRTVGERVYGDLPEFVDEAYLADVARLNAAVLLSLANAPSAPADARIILAGLSNDTTIRWTASPEPDTAGYEVVYRETSAPFWQHVVDVGDQTEHTLDRSTDNWLFGVRAYDENGFRSPVSFPAASGR